MNYTQELKTKQTQRLVLTSDMKQSLSILQMSCTELGEFLNNEMMENPLLEIDENRSNLMAEDDVQKINWTSYIKSCESYSPNPKKQDINNTKAFTFEKYSYNDITYRTALDIQFDLVSKKVPSAHQLP